MPYEKPIEWRKDGPHWTRNPLWNRWKYIQREGDEYPYLVLAKWRIWGGERLSVIIIRYEGGRWRWPREIHVSGVYDNGVPFTCGSVGWMGYQLEWSFKKRLP